MSVNAHKDGGRARRAVASDDGDRRATRALAALCSCGTAGLAGLLVGLATEEELIEVLSPAVLTGFSALLFGGRHLLGGLKR